MRRRFNKGSVLNRCLRFFEECLTKTRRLGMGRFSCRIAISRVYFDHRKRPENKKLRILDKRCFNVQSLLDFPMILHKEKMERICIEIPIVMDYGEHNVDFWKFFESAGL